MCGTLVLASFSKKEDIPKNLFSFSFLEIKDNLLLVKFTNSSLLSIPINFLPCILATTGNVPLPTNGSIIISPSLVDAKTSLSINSIGFCEGCFPDFFQKLGSLECPKHFAFVFRHLFFSIHHN